MSNQSYPVRDGMVQIPGGTFCMGSNDGDEDEKPVHSVTVDAFELDLTEVTVAQYRACVKAGKCDAPEGSGCNWDESDRDDHPVNCVNWDQARTYCGWAGKRLPTEEEWEYTARGTDGRTYPWGNESPSEQLCGKQASTCKVGSFPTGNSPFGVKDMAGNVWEWTDTTYCNSYAKNAPCEVARVVRGGGWGYFIPSNVRAAFRFRYGPSYRLLYLGFRCAR
jgi:formylglycine-generating enzyme required for sulfatase activity